MQTVRFKKKFKYSTDGLHAETASVGDVIELSDELAASAVKSGAGEVVDLEAEQSAHENEVSKAAEKAESEKVDVSLQPEDAPDGMSDLNDALTDEAGKTASPEDKSVGPAEDKADSEE